MRAVASVWPYITIKLRPVCAAYSANSLCSFGASFPPACVMVLREGSSMSKKESRLNISYV